jgi:hypothetical protein
VNVQIIKVFFRVIRQREFLMRLKLGLGVLAVVGLWVGSVVIFGSSLEYHWPGWMTAVSAPFAGAPLVGLALLLSYVIGAGIMGDW